MSTAPEIARQTNARASALTTPLSVLLELTYRCNLSCYYCFQKEYPATNELTTVEWIHILDDLEKCGTLYLTISGGEPFVRPDLLEIVKAARNRTFAVSIISNGTLLSPALVTELAAVKLMDIGISLLAADAALHDSLSKHPGSFDAARTALRLCRHAGLRTIIKHTISQANIGSAPGLQQIADTEGHLLECDTMVAPDAFSTPSPYALTSAQAEQMMDQCYPGAIVPRAEEGNEWNLHCDAGRSLAGIRPDGTVVPCIMLPISFGNAAQSPFLSVWQSDAAMAYRNQEASLSVKCQHCHEKSVCARCPGIAYAEATGDWQGPSPSLCAHAQALAARSLHNDSNCSPR